ncbi:hypothetical protein KPL71_008509 [Citrus sinensis]|uniref:Uncharacterized protein n=1 Tax=Citrus sinensis TaxID=2711 RepID=A0ACB8M768_CITSI|nr:hypothetical protein KPL71_008509 [Citrus sinensis]
MVNCTSKPSKPSSVSVELKNPVWFEAMKKVLEIVSSYNNSSHGFFILFHCYCTYTAKNLPDVSKIEPFNGEHFKRWQDKIHDILDVHNLAKYLTLSPPEEGCEDFDNKTKTWTANNKICRNKAQRKGDNKNPPKANPAERDEIIVVVVVSEVNMVAEYNDWVIDSGATKHICGNRNSFFEYTPVREGEEFIFLGDSRSTPVLGKGKVLLKLTSGKTLSLSNVLHVPEIRYNLISIFVLGKAGVKVSFEGDKIVMTKNGVFVGKGYCSGELFKLNVLNVIINENVSSSAYIYCYANIVDSINLWHGGLVHVNFSYIKKMKELGLLFKLNLSNDKCDVCVESKSTKKTCKPVQNRETELLSLIHSDLGDLKQTMTRGGKRRSKRMRMTTSFGDDYYVFLAENDPMTFKEAMTSRDAPLWREAINCELDSIMSNHVWELVDLPPVAKGFSQKKDIDYFDTYAPVTRITSIRVLIALAAIHNLHIHQTDVKTAFLNGDLDEEIYMSQPEGCVVPGTEHKVCKLVKSLYGLKQAPKQWHEKFDQVLVSNGYVINDSNKCIYFKSIDATTYVIICLYVDDMLILSPNLGTINETKWMLASNFDMKDMGEADVILGIKITKTSDSFRLSQEHYVEKMLRRFGYYDKKLVSTPYDANTHLKKNLKQSVDQLRYAQIIGSLMYLMNSTRPDIAYAVGRLSRYTQNPMLEGYSDANWISGYDEIKSTSGYIFTLSGGAVSWKSPKQTCIARSTMESELIALEKACTEAEWLRNLLVDLLICTHPPTSVSIHCDCQAAIAKAKSEIYNGKSRHIRLRHNIIKQLLKSGVVSLDFVKSELNLADPLTKPLNRRLVVNMSRGMGLLSRTVDKSDGYPTYVIGDPMKISRYKLRLVAKGFHQTQGVDYNETFSPVVKAFTIKAILTLTIMNNWSLRQVNGNNFLHGYLIEDVYMQQPEGFVDQIEIAFPMNKLSQFLAAPTVNHCEACKRFFRSSLTELGVTLTSTPILWCDNQSATALASNPKFHSRTKHIELDVHFLQEKVATQSFQVRYVPSSDNVTDIMTKALSYHLFRSLCTKLNLITLG